ncbi:MAG: excinuclease ABC subunit UvrA [Bacteroidaceae bacterium]
MRMNEYISIKGARVNNLKNISLDIPRGKFIVITGLSGSGKSSLAFDTIYAEGQRRYVESLSAYARQFLGRMSKPECDYIKGIPPAIAIEQKVSSRNPRSTVGTSTEIYDYLRLLFARVGRTISPISGEEVKQHTPKDVVACVQTYPEGTRFTVLSPLFVREGRTLQEQLDIYLKQGLTRLDVKGEIVHIEDWLKTNAQTTLDANHPLYLLIDRLTASSTTDRVERLVDSVETAFFEGNGDCVIRIYPALITHSFSSRYEADGIHFEEPSDALFSFNSPVGACPKCEGFGRIIGIDESLVVPNSALSVFDGAVVCWRGEKMSVWKDEFIRRAESRDFPIFEPYYNLTRKQKDFLWHGDAQEQALPKEEQVSIDAFFQMLEVNQYKIQYRVMLARYRGKTTCPDCYGRRLKPQADYVKIDGYSISDLVELSITELLNVFKNMVLTEHEQNIAGRLLVEINTRLNLLCHVGLSYLTLNRMSATLSGGESQRINLAKSLGSSLIGSLYILDEPSIGLHSHDTHQLISVLRQLQQLGNTVIVVEHDEEIMRAADYLIDIGPDAGRKGGEIVYQGESFKTFNKKEPLPASVDASKSYTLRYLLGMEKIEIPKSRRTWNNYIEVIGARENNLKGINVKFPLNVMTVVTGVSGSGKSTLVNTLLYRGLKRAFDEVCERPGEFVALEGDLKSIKCVEFIDQNPIGKSSRSNPVTYIKAYDEIRKLMAEQPLAKQMDFTAAFFSFNTDGGRCEECKGDGTIKVEMQFMADLVLECESCHGKRFKTDVLDVRFCEKNIYDLLNMTVNEAIEFFTEHQQERIAKRLLPLQRVGLGYIKLGQSSSTLSGGENQRVKLAYYLGLEKVAPTLFIFDEPTTGLHFHDIKKLLEAFDALILRGHSVLIIEHNLDVIKCADYVIDLGPEGGNKGGSVVACGTPEEVAKSKKGYTALDIARKLEEENGA